MENKKYTKHGQSVKGKTTKEYWTWHDMIQRCENKNNVRYYRYGKRGIKVCEEWHDFVNFFKDMGKKPSPKHQLDRINNDGNYEKNNCRWVTCSENNCNRGITKRNKTGFKGVSIHACGKFQATIRKDKKTYYLGLFDNPEDAARVYNEKSKELHGEFSVLNKI